MNRMVSELVPAPRSIVQHAPSCSAMPADGAWSDPDPWQHSSHGQRLPADGVRASPGILPAALRSIADLYPLRAASAHLHAVLKLLLDVHAQAAASAQSDVALRDLHTRPCSRLVPSCQSRAEHQFEPWMEQWLSACLLLRVRRLRSGGSWSTSEASEAGVTPSTGGCLTGSDSIYVWSVAPVDWTASGYRGGSYRQRNDSGPTIFKR